MVSTITKFSRVATTVADSEWSNVNLTEVIERQLDASPSMTTTKNCDMINTIDTDASATTTSTTGESRCSEEDEQEGDFSSLFLSTPQNFETKRRRLLVEDDKSTTSEPKQNTVPPVVPDIPIEFNPEEMIPIVIKTDLSELQHLMDGEILAERSLSWFEFIQIYRPKPDDYILKGDNECILDLKSKIGDYIDTSAVVSCYPVFIHAKRVHQDPLSSQSEGPKSQQRKFKRKPPRRRKSKQKRRKIQLETNITHIDEDNMVRTKTRSKFNNKHADHSNEVLDTPQNADKTEGTLNTHTNLSLPNLKSQVMNFVKNKFSNRDMLRIRGELMKLKDEEDYFKLTSLTPLTAGLLDQMLCRNLPTQDSTPS